MLTTKPPSLRISTKIQVLQCLFSGCDLELILGKLEIEELLELQRFLWEKTVEFGIKAKGANFAKADVTKRMISVSAYQQMKNCKEAISVCKETACIRKHPSCATEKVKGHIQVMKDAIGEYIAKPVHNS